MSPPLILLRCDVAEDGVDRMEEVMIRTFAFVVGSVVILVLSTADSFAAAEFGTAEEAKAMLERAVTAAKEDCVVRQRV